MQWSGFGRSAGRANRWISVRRAGEQRAEAFANEFASLDLDQPA